MLRPADTCLVIDASAAHAHAAPEKDLAKMPHARALPTPRPLRRSLAWLPAVLLVAWGVLAAAGVQLTPSSSAAGTSATVAASVPLEIRIGGDCPSASYTVTSLALGEQLMGACTLTFGSNGTVGTVLKVEHPRSAGNAFCQADISPTPVDCGTKPSFADATGTATLPAGAFGVKVASAPTCSTATWTNGNYYGLRDATTAPGAGDTICTQSPGTTDGSYALEFRAHRQTSTAAGTYRARADFTVEAS